MGFSYPEWKGPFYPEKLPPQQMLAYYARHFSAVEINSTCWPPFSPPDVACAPRHFVGIRRALLPRGSSSDSVLVAHAVHVLPKERHR
ncbi:MAG: DUF72 domain-containing protein [candidate division NC10 bacterium]